MYCLCPTWLARVITLVLVLRHSNENHSITWTQKHEKYICSNSYTVCCGNIPRKYAMRIFPFPDLMLFFSVSPIRKSLFIHAQIIYLCFSRYQEFLSSSLETNICIVYRGQQRTYFVFRRGRILLGQKFSSAIYVTFLAQIWRRILLTMFWIRRKTCPFEYAITDKKTFLWKTFLDERNYYYQLGITQTLRRVTFFAIFSICFCDYFSRETLPDTICG